VSYQGKILVEQHMLLRKIRKVLAERCVPVSVGNESLDRIPKIIDVSGMKKVGRPSKEWSPPDRVVRWLDLPWSIVMIKGTAYVAVQRVEGEQWELRGYEYLLKDWEPLPVSETVR